MEDPPHRTEGVLGVRRVVSTTIPTEWGEFDCLGYVDDDGIEHVALVRGRPADVDAPLVRLHSECFTGDVLGSQRCDCGPQLAGAFAAIDAEGVGVVVYLRGHEGRGMGLLEKLKAYRLQDAGLDTVEANLELGFPADARDYGAGAAILLDLGVRSVRLLSNNPAKLAGLAANGVSGRLQPHVIEATDRNRTYLDTKRTRLGHALPAF